MTSPGVFGAATKGVSMRIIVGTILVALGAHGVHAACSDLATVRQTVEATCPCAGQSNAGAYKKCVKGALKTAGVKGACKKQMLQTAAKSVCGKTGVVVCCTPGKKGKVVKAAKCKGTACTSGAANGFTLFPLSGADCSAAGSCPTTTTTTTSPASTTVTTTSTPEGSTTTTQPTLCVGGEPDGTKTGPEECDDGNLVTADGCTNACTLCGNGTVTPPEI
jgi:cysteine-rich repeat protein